MKIAVINGSPKGKYSITLQTVRYLQRKFPAHEFSVLHAGQTIRALEKETDFQEFYYIEYQGVGEGRKTPTESITATDLLVKDYDRLLDAVMELWPEDAWYTIQYDQCFKGEMEVRISMSQGNGRGYYVYSLADGALIPGDQKIVGEERFGRMVVTNNTESGNIARTTYIFIAE